jgi:acetyltransferase
MLARLCSGRLVVGPRALPPERVADVTAVLCALSEIATQNPDVVEIDINPLIVSAVRVVAVDILIGISLAA